MDTESYPKKSSSGTDPEKTEVPSLPYAGMARRIVNLELFKGVYTPVELPPSGVAKILPSNKLSQVLKGITEKGLQSFDPGVFKMHVGALGTMQNALGDQSSKLAKLIQNVLLPALPDISEITRQFVGRQSVWLRAFEGLDWQGLMGARLPENLCKLKDFTFSEIQQVIFCDGIALYGVPNEEIAGELLRADDADSRRKLLVSKWAEIRIACCHKLREVSEVPERRDQAAYALEMISSIDRGYYAPAQALAASMVEALTIEILGKEERKKYTSYSTMEDALSVYENFLVREWLALSPMFQAFQKFYPGSGDPIPALFNRHATVHTVSAQQFTQANAITGALFAVSLLCYLYDEASGRGKNL